MPTSVLRYVAGFRKHVHVILLRIFSFSNMYLRHGSSRYTACAQNVRLRHERKRVTADATRIVLILPERRVPDYGSIFFQISVVISDRRITIVESNVVRPFKVTHGR